MSEVNGRVCENERVKESGCLFVCLFVSKREEREKFWDKDEEKERERKIVVCPFYKLHEVARRQRSNEKDGLGSRKRTGQEIMPRQTSLHAVPPKFLENYIFSIRKNVNAHAKV